MLKATSAYLLILFACGCYEPSEPDRASLAESTPAPDASVTTPPPPTSPTTTPATTPTDPCFGCGYGGSNPSPTPVPIPPPSIPATPHDPYAAP